MRQVRDRTGHHAAARTPGPLLRQSVPSRGGVRGPPAHRRDRHAGGPRPVGPDQRRPWAGAAADDGRDRQGGAAIACPARRIRRRELMSNTTTLDTFALINAYADDQDGAAQMIAAMDAAERADVIAKLLGLLS